MNLKNGERVLDIIQIEIVNCKQNNIEPKILFLGSYAYFLLKKYLEEIKMIEVQYKELYEGTFFGEKLKICIDRETLLEGCHREETNTVKVYGS
jgi:hypothetical protein